MSIKSFCKWSSVWLCGAFAAFSATANEQHPLSQKVDNFITQTTWQIEPYLGADVFSRNMRYRDEPTHPFQEHLNTFQPFIGLRLHKYFGIEAGYQQSEKGTKERFFNYTEMPQFFGGAPMLLEDPGFWGILLDLQQTNEVRGWNVGAMGFYPLCNNKTEVFAKLGYAKLRFDMEYRLQGIIFDDPTVPAVGVSMDHGHLYRNRGLLELTAGLKHAFSEHFGGRAFIVFNRISRLNVDSSFPLSISQLGNQANILSKGIQRESGIAVRPHNSFGFGVGLYYNWG